MKLEEFLAGLVAVNPIQVNYKTDACNWTFNGLDICHERTYLGRGNGLKKTPAQMFYGLFKEVKSTYWTNTLYVDKSLANSDANKSGGWVELDFYCDEENPTYFIAFDDFDKMARFMFGKIVTTLSRKDDSSHYQGRGGGIVLA